MSSPNFLQMIRHTSFLHATECLHMAGWSEDHWSPANKGVLILSLMNVWNQEPMSWRRSMQLGCMTIQIMLRIFKSFWIFSDTISIMRQNNFHIWKLFSSNWWLILNLDCDGMYLAGSVSCMLLRQHMGSWWNLKNDQNGYKSQVIKVWTILQAVQLRRSWSCIIWS